MHELSICQALIGEVESVARRNEARRVLSIVVQIGPLSGVVPELLESAYTMARAGTVAGEAELVIESMPLRVHCERCACDSVVSNMRLVCTQCGDWRTRVISGDELMLASVELERDTAH